ncbi:MAG: hypothetical protein ABIF10_08210 [Candidatus Woesearchaeota archaeon]
MTDISKRTILVLLILVVVSSLISTWAFVTSVNAPQHVIVKSTGTSSSTADLQLRIQNPAVSASSADMQLEIIEPRGG